jgi:hypothetical protein
MSACLYTLFSQWQCRGDRGYTIVKYQTLRPARASDGGDGRDRHRPCVCRRAAGCYITGSAHGHRRKVITMHTRHSTRGNRQKWVVMLVLLAVWLVASPVPGHAWRGGRVFISPSIVVPFGPFWRPYWGPSPYAYPYASPYAYLTASVCPASTAQLLVLLRQSYGLLPVCATVPRRMETSEPDAPIGGFPTHAIKREVP